jgi:simple sugar transport system permease protein
VFQDVIRTCLSPVAAAAALRLSCPLIIGSTGGCFNEKTSTGNLAYECLMLTGAFFGAYGSYLTGSPLMGSLLAMASGLVLAAIYGVLVYHLNCNAIIVSVAYNSAAWALTTLLLVVVWNTRGQFNDPSIVSYSNLEWAFLKQFPTLDMIFNYNILMVYFAFLYTFAGYVVMYKTPFGLRLRGVGINSEAAQAAGINVRKYRWICLVIMGVSMGLAGSYMPLCGMSLFSENMTRGRGFLCLTSTLVGKGHPIKTMFVALLFGYANAMTLVLSTYGFPTQIIGMLPYVMVLIVLLSVGVRNYKGGADISGDTL